MNKLQIFNSEEFGEIRSVDVNGKPYFVATDVAKALGYAKPNNAVSTHCRSTLKQGIATKQGNMSEMVLIPEGDIYRLIIRSKLPSAERFERWVFDEVLPQIRKTGSYIKPMSTAEQIKLLAQGNTELNERVDRVVEDVASLKNDMPLYGCEIDEVQKHVKRKGVNVLGGKTSEAYKDNSVRSKVYSDIYSQLKREYGCVSSYKSIKRKYIEEVHEFIEKYEPPTVLAENIRDCNMQMRIA